MKDIYAAAVIREQTTPQKRSIHAVFPYDVIHYIVSGKGYFNDIPLEAGQGFICKKGNLCRYHQDPDCPWEYIYIRLRGEDAGDFLKQYETSGYIFRYHPIDTFVNLVNRPCLIPEFLYDREYATALFTMIRSLHTDYTIHHAPDPADNKYVKAAKEYMQLHYFHPLSMDEIAERLHISRAYLRNLFVSCEGLSPKQYLTELRMYHACLLLKNGDLPISEVAVSVGYSDPFQFMKAFRSHHKMTPSQYRKSYRN